MFIRNVALSAIVGLLCLNSGFAKGVESRTELLEFKGWTVERVVVDGESACVLYSERDQLDVSMLGVKQGVAIGFSSPSWKFRKRLAIASIVTGDVTPIPPGDLFTTTGDIIVIDPHSEFNGDTVYLEMPDVNTTLGSLRKMSRAGSKAKLVDKDGKILAEFSSKDSRRPMQVWIDCVEGL